MAGTGTYDQASSGRKVGGVTWERRTRVRRRTYVRCRYLEHSNSIDEHVNKTRPFAKDWGCRKVHLARIFKDFFSKSNSTRSFKIWRVVTSTGNGKVSSFALPAQAD
jgi:hypothetical protein